MQTRWEGPAEDQVRDVLNRLREAWERGDGAAYGSVFSEDAQYVNAPGERLHGREAIAESHQEIFTTFFKDTRLGRAYPTYFRWLSPEVVLVESAGSVLFPGEDEGNVPPNGLMTLVLAKQGLAWQIVSFQNTPTGKWRKLKFMWRFVFSRVWGRRASRSERGQKVGGADRSRTGE